jgi:uncharacterized membrane protein
MLHDILNEMSTWFPATRADLTEQLFRAGMYWRILYGSGRILLGFLLLRLVGTPAIDVFRNVMRHLVGHNPDDALFGTVAHALAAYGLSITYFMVAYLFFWGLVDIFLSVAMLKHILWAFPVSLTLIAAFIVYEVYRYSHTHSPVLLAIMAIDVFLIVLIRREELKLERQLAA